MPHLGQYSHQQMLMLAERSRAEYLRASSASGDTQLMDVHCEYIGVAQANGAFDREARIRKTSNVGFRWRVLADGIQTTVVEKRCDNAMSHGIAMPPSWQVAVKCHSLQSDADRSSAQVNKTDARFKARCKVLGQPRRCPFPNEADGFAPGTIVELPLGSASVEFALCAHVHEKSWLCTRGHFVEDMFQISDPFGEGSLILKTLETDVLQQDHEAPRKRIKPHLHKGQLLGLAATRPDHWDAVVSIATWHAEMMRARLEGRQPDEQLAHSAFERNPFRWHNVPGKVYRSRVMVHWTLWRGGQDEQIFQTHRLDHALERGFPAPPQTNQNDSCMHLWRNLQAIAELETQERKAPCVYVGVELPGGKFQPDPSKWPTEYSIGSRRQTCLRKAWVHFEWVGVTIGNQPYTTAVTVDYLLYESALQSLPRRQVIVFACLVLRAMGWGLGGCVFTGSVRTQTRILSQSNAVLHKGGWECPLQRFFKYTTHPQKPCAQFLQSRPGHTRAAGGAVSRWSSTA